MGARILVIEDNPANLELMRYVLTAFGHEVTTAQDGEDGFNTVLSLRPQLVICDLQLPQVDGFEVARRMKKHPALHGIPLVAVTAFAMVGDRDRVLKAGFDGYISKPIEPESFIRKVDEFLAHAQRAIQSPAVHGVHSSAAAVARSSGKRVLVVDDLAANIDLLCAILASAGHEVSAAASLAQARQSAEASAPDLVISDYHLQDEDGGELLRWIRGHPRLGHTPFIFLSSTLQSSPVPVEGERGADRFLTRPITPEMLLEAVAAHLVTPGAT
jgi:two-component system cell cycle response regulator